MPTLTVRNAALWFSALVLFVAVAMGTQSVLRGHPQSIARVGAAPSSMSAGPNGGGITATKPILDPALTTRVVIFTTQQLLINQDRVRYHFGQLTWSTCLAYIAKSNAVRIAKQGYLSHTNGATRDLGCHLGYHAGENVGWYSPIASDTRINTAFMASPVHRANILGSHYRYVGTSWVKGANGNWYVAVEFG
ncbi:MAG TPA: CAP domain-containing protein [Candidatus Dormibacteraeota bacterium]